VLFRSKTSRQYARSNVNVWLATMTPDTSSVGSCLEEIAEAVGIRGYYASTAKLRREVAKRLLDTKGLLIVDEAQHLSLGALEEIRSIHDSTEVGMILCGNESIYSRLTGNNRAAHFAQLFSRIGKRLRLNLPLIGDVRAIAEAFNVNAKPEIDDLAGIARKPGALRGIVKTLRMASIFAAGEEVPLNRSHIKAALKDLGMEE